MNPKDIFLLYQRDLERRKEREDAKRFVHMAIGLRKDGAFVCSYNNTNREQRTWSGHAEARLSRKLDVGSTVWVMRLSKDNAWKMSLPCPSCLQCMIRKGVKTVYFTTNGDYGKLVL